MYLNDEIKFSKNQLDAKFLTNCELGSHKNLQSLREN